MTPFLVADVQYIFLLRSPCLCFKLHSICFLPVSVSLARMFQSQVLKENLSFCWLPFTKPCVLLAIAHCSFKYGQRDWFHAFCFAHLAGSSIGSSNCPLAFLSLSLDYSLHSCDWQRICHLRASQFLPGFKGWSGSWQKIKINTEQESIVNYFYYLFFLFIQGNAYTSAHWWRNESWLQFFGACLCYTWRLIDTRVTQIPAETIPFLSVFSLQPPPHYYWDAIKRQDAGRQAVLIVRWKCAILKSFIISAISYFIFLLGPLVSVYKMVRNSANTNTGDGWCCASHGNLKECCKCSVLHGLDTCHG